MKKYFDFLQKRRQKVAATYLRFASEFYQTIAVRRRRFSYTLLLAAVLSGYAWTTLERSMPIPTANEVEMYIELDRITTESIKADNADTGGPTVNFGFGPGVTYVICGGEGFSIHYLTSDNSIPSFTAPTGLYTISNSHYTPNINTSDTIRDDIVIATVGSGSNLCRDTAMVEVPPTPNIQLSTPLANSEICFGDSIRINTTLGGTASDFSVSIKNGTGVYNKATAHYIPTEPGSAFREDTLIFTPTNSTSSCVPLVDTFIVKVYSRPTIQVASPSVPQICFNESIRIDTMLGGSATSYTVSQQSGSTNNGSGLDYDRTTRRYRPSVEPAGVSRQDTLIFTTVNTNVCTVAKDTFIVEVFSRPIFDLASSGFVEFGDSIKIDTTVGGGATSFSIVSIKSGNNVWPTNDYLRETSHYKPSVEPTDFYRVDTLIARSLTNGVSGICPKTVMLPITVFRASDIQILTDPLNTQLICSTDSLTLDADLDPSSETEVVWKSLNATGVFSDSLQQITKYFPDRVTTLAGRVDPIEATLIEMRPIEWIDGHNVMIGTGASAGTAARNQLVRSMGTGVWGEAGARSKHELEARKDGFVELRVNGDYDVAIGLSKLNTSNPNTSNDYTTIDYGLFQDATAKVVYAIEKGIPVSSTQTYDAAAKTDSFRVERAGNMIFYKKNKVVFHQTTTTVTDVLFIDAAIQNLNDTINATTSILPTGAIEKRDTFDVRVQFSPFVDFGVADTVTVCHGDSILIPITATPSTAMVTTTPTNGSIYNTASNYYIPPSNFDDTIRIERLTAQPERFGSCFGEISTVIIKVLPRDSIQITAPNGTNICENDSLDLMAILEVDSTIFQWSTIGARGTFSRTDSTETKYVPNPVSEDTNTRIDTIIVTTIPLNGSECATYADTMEVTVSRQSVSLTPVRDTFVCENEIIQLTTMINNSVSNDEVRWLSVGTNSQAEFINNGGVVSPITGTGASIRYRSSLPFAGTPYVDTIRYFTMDPSVTVCGPAEDTVFITIYPQQVLEIIDPVPSATGGGDLDTVFVCQGESVSITVKTEGTVPQVVWSAANGTFSRPNDTSTVYQPNLETSMDNRVDTVIVRAASLTGCTPAEDTLLVVITPPPALMQSSDSLRFCVGDTINLSATFFRSNRVSWILKDSTLGSLRNVTADKATYMAAGTFTGVERGDVIYLQSDSTLSCPAVLDSITVFVVNPPSLELGMDRQLCADGGADLMPQLGLANQISYTSSFGTVDPVTNVYLPDSIFPALIRQDIIKGVATDSFGVCPAVADSLVVTVVQNVEILVPDSIPICEGDTLILDDNYSGTVSDFSATVRDNSGQVLLRNNQVVYIPNENTTQSTRTDQIIITNNDVDGIVTCPGFTDTVRVNVLNTARATLVQDTTICDGNITNLVVESFGTLGNFSSKFSSSLVNYPTNPPSVADGPMVDTIIYGTNAINFCTSDRDTVIVTIQPNGTYALDLQDTTICEINTLALDAGVTDNEANYQWRVLGEKGTFDGDTLMRPVYRPNMGLTTADRLDTIILNVTKKDNICFTNTDTLVVQVIQGITFTPLRDTAICAGASVALGLRITGPANLLWSSSGGTFSSTNTSTTTYTPSELTSSFRIDTIHVDMNFPEGGCADTRETMLVAVYSDLPIDAGVDSTICAGFDLQLNGTLGFGLNQATWSVLGGNGTFDDTTKINAIYTPNAVTGTTDRVDTLILSTANGLACLTGSDTVLLTVKLEPTVSLGADRTVFNDAAVPLMAALDEKVEVSRWTSNNGSFQNSGLDGSTYIPNDLGNLTVRVDQIIYEAFFTNTTCGSKRDTLFVTVMAPPTISRGTNEAFCQSLCLETAMVNIDRNTGGVVVLANNIDLFDTCQVRADLDFRLWSTDLGIPEPTTVLDFPSLPNSVSFDCSDRGLQQLNVYVAEDSMNVQLCPVTIQVEDAGLTCGERTVSGRITTFRGEPVAGFQVFVEDPSEVGGVVPNPVRTDADGRYSFTLDVDRAYRIVPRNDEDLAMGVTAFDNVVISRHILGLQPFESPFQTIAADVNKSGTVTTFDIVLIRRVVLTQASSFTNNTSWRFIDADFEFESIAAAASAPFRESFTVTANSGNIQDMDFIAVKTGDANGTVNPNGLTTLAEDRNGTNDRLLQTANIAVEKGKVYEVPFRFLASETMQSYQFTLQHQGLELLNIQSGVVTPEHFGTTMTKKGLLTAAWSTTSPVAGDQDWFTLVFKANQSGNLSELLSLNSMVTPMEAVTADEEKVGVALTFINTKIASLELFQNKPNPFKQKTIIGFALPAAGKADLTILDLQGKVLKIVSGEFAKGYNEVSVDFTDLPKGIFYYRLSTVHGTKVQKLMRIE
ncbi:MAG: T9SS type A sorting domain-containing protein [Bacteroidota bacterium]